MSRALARHLEHARNPQWVYEPGDIIGMRKLVNDWARDVRVSRGINRSDDDDEREARCIALLDTLESIPHAISPAFTAKGLAWFDSMRINQRSGIALSSRKWRNTKLTRCFDERKRAIVDGFERFEFVGFENNGGNWYYPVYRVHGNGEHFDYCYSSWQSGASVTFPRDPVKVEQGKVYQLNPSACPHFIMVPEHYRNNGKCLCDDPGAKIMRTWGYKWNKAKGLWT